MRTLSNWLLRRNAFQPLALAGFAIAMIAVHMLLAARVHPLVLWAVALLAIFIAVTNVRGSYLEADDQGRVRTAWVTLGAVIGLSMFLVSAAAYVLIPAAVVRALAFGLMMLVPAAVVVCLAMSVATERIDVRATVHKVVRGGTIALALMLVLAALFAAAEWAKERLGIPGGIAALAAVSLTALAYVPVSRAADGVRRKVLEHAAIDDRR